MSERVWTVIEILNTARGFLAEKKIENPRGDAEALLCKALGMPRIELYLQHDRPLEESQIAVFRELLRRRAKKEPLQLIIGSVEFCGITIETAPGLLIPRPETEGLAEFVIEELKAVSQSDPVRVLDIGTGTGCLAVTIASKVPRTLVDAVDVDFEAVRCATHNAERNHVADRVRAILADVLSPRFESLVAGPYDMIVSNPPYVTEEEYASLAPEIRNHEAKHALVGADNGLIFYRRMADLFPALLKEDGWIAVEIGATQDKDVRSIFAEHIDSLTVRRDLAGLPRIVAGKLQKVHSSKIIPS
jgi:release factor glutamine methyltransferase